MGWDWDGAAAVQENVAVLVCSVRVCVAKLELHFFSWFLGKRTLPAFLRSCGGARG